MARLLDRIEFHTVSISEAVNPSFGARNSLRKQPPRWPLSEMTSFRLARLSCPISRPSACAAGQVRARFRLFRRCSKTEAKRSHDRSVDVLGECSSWLSSRAKQRYAKRETKDVMRGTNCCDAPRREARSSERKQRRFYNAD